MSAGPAHPTRVFVRLKARLVINGIRRTTRSGWAKVGFAVSMFAAVCAAGLGFATAVGLRSFWDPAGQHRMLILATTGIVIGWWFGPLLSGGVDETIDPARLALVPLTRRQVRRGQIAAGFVGISPLVVMIWVAGIVVGMARTWSSVPSLLLNGVVVLLAALMGSRAIATTLARLARSRRGGDLAALIAVTGGSTVFAGLQLIRFVSPEQLDSVAAVLAWTPPGMAGEAFELASAGRPGDALWRTGSLALVALASGWWWSRQLDRLLIEPSNNNTVRLADQDASTPAIFGGTLRRRLPRTASGAAVARELIYLTRSPGRRAALLGGTVLGLVYVAFFVGAFGNNPTVVLSAPIAMLFALQYASNQLGVDPGAFWLEVACGPTLRARWAGRQLLGVIAVLVPVIVAGLILAVWTGGWVEFGIVMVTMGGATMSMIGVGSWLSPLFVTPVPDSGNPFGSRQAMSGTGCSAAIVGMLYLVLIGVLVAPAELALRWTLDNQSLGVAAAVAVVIVAIDLAVWRLATNAAVRQLPGRELEVLARLDPRLNV